MRKSIRQKHEPKFIACYKVRIDIYFGSENWQDTGTISREDLNSLWIQEPSETIRLEILLMKF